MSFSNWLKQAAESLRQAGLNDPRSEAEILAATILNCPRAGIISGPQSSVLTDEAFDRLNQALRRRQKGEPLAYICGSKDFYKAKFKVGPGVLIPRPETELVVETALKLAAQLPPVVQIADFGAGSGCIGLSLLLEWPNARLTAVEPSSAARPYLAANIEDHHLKDRVQIVEQTVENFVPREKFQLIVANPPYIARDDASVMESVRDFEPHEALFADEEGLGAIRRWIQIANRQLIEGGFLVMEIGAGQASFLNLDKALKEKWATFHFLRDLAGHERVLIAQRLVETTNKS